MERFSLRQKLHLNPGALSPAVSEDIERVRSLLACGALNPIKAGRTLFSFGYELDKLGLSEQADYVYRENIELLESLVSKKSSPLSPSHLASLAFEHGRTLFTMGRYDSAIASFLRSVEIYDSTICLDASQSLIELLSDSLAWLARSQRKATMFGPAEKSYKRAISLKRHCLKLPQSRDQRTIISNRLGTTLLGYSKILRKRGRLKAAERALQEAESLLL